MKKTLLFLSLLSTQAFANLHLAPPDFESEYGRAVFVDFKTAEYDITYDIEAKTSIVKSRITFTTTKPGMPVFDLVPEPKNLKVDGYRATQFTTTFPGNVSKLRQLSSILPVGEHVMEMENEITTNLEFHEGYTTVSNAFWIRDLKDRMFLEQYVPSNFEFDQYKMTINVKFVGLERSALQEFFTNGKVTKTSSTSWTIEYPEYFTVSCPFYHVTPKSWMSRRDFTYKSISGRDIPMTVYSNDLVRTKRFKPEALKVMKELESDYGAWGHPSFVAYGTFPGTGGMEHSGATATSFEALDHEMLHSYFAKGVMPANGNSGWLDEAIASWRDKGYQRNPTTGFGGSNLGSQSVYKRHTDNRAYSLGAAFMAYLDWRLQDMGGLKAFLKGYFQTYKHQVITGLHFKNNLEFFSGLSFDEDFNTYIWGTNTKDAQELFESNPNHPNLSEKELKALL